MLSFGRAEVSEAVAAAVAAGGDGVSRREGRDVAAQPAQPVRRQGSLPREAGTPELFLCWPGGRL